MDSNVTATPKISVVTVVYNDCENIRETLESFFAQTWAEKELIVIDGGSTDGTANIVHSYADRLAYWCSEKDDGIYDAMNKGIAHATGQWVNILNAGDRFVAPDTLEHVAPRLAHTTAAVVYGNSIEQCNTHQQRLAANPNTASLEYAPTYRHGASFVRTDVQRANPYDLSKQKQLGYALDWEMIYRLYTAGHKFEYVDVDVEVYKKEGTSNHPIKNLWLNYLITSRGHFSFKKWLWMTKMILVTVLRGSWLYRWSRAFVLEWVVNGFIPIIPFWALRRPLLRLCGLRTGKGCFIMKRNYIINPNRLRMGRCSHINRGGLIDARGDITIGDNVSISHNVSLVTGSHQKDDPHFCGIFKPITIGDYAWLGVGCTVLQGVSIGRGAVVCAGAVVTKDVPDYTVVAGVPARKIGERNSDLRYHCATDLIFS